LQALKKAIFFFLNRQIEGFNKGQIVYLFHVAVGVHVVPVVGVDGVAGCVGWGVGGGGGVKVPHPGSIGDGVQLSFQG
jgi:hypothetical protein